jgi:hypothetical protein
MTKVRCICISSYSNHDDFLDLEYWKVPSRRIYVAKKGEYEDIIRTKARKRLSLNQRKRNVFYTESHQSDEDGTNTSQLIKKVRYYNHTFDISCTSFKYARLIMTSLSLYKDTRRWRSLGKIKPRWWGLWNAKFVKTYHVLTVQRFYYSVVIK